MAIFACDIFRSVAQKFNNIVAAINFLEYMFWWFHPVILHFIQNREFRFGITLDYDQAVYARCDTPRIGIYFTVIVTVAS